MNTVNVPEIVICMGSSCFSRGNEKNLSYIENYLKTNNLKDDVDLKLSGCLCKQLCCDGPNVFINNHNYKVNDTSFLIDLLDTYILKKNGILNEL